MFVHLPGYLDSLGAGEAQIGSIIGALSISAIVVRPLLGRMMDQRGRKPVLLLGGVANVIAVCAYLTADSLGPWMYAIRIMHGVGEAALFSVVFTIAADEVPASRRTEGIAMFGVSGLLPLSLGGLLGDWILAHGTYYTLFAVSAAIAVAALIVSLPIPETRPEKSSSDGKPQTLIGIFLNRRLIPLWLLTFGFTFGLTSYFTFLKTYIGHVHIGSVGLFFLSYSIAAVSLRLFFSWVPERIGAKRALVPAMLSLLLGLLMLAHIESATELAIAGALCGLGHAYVFPIISALVVTRAEASSRGTAMTLFTALFDVGALVGAPLLGTIVETADYPIMFTVAASTASVFAVVFFVADRSPANNS